MSAEEPARLDAMADEEVEAAARSDPDNPPIGAATAARAARSRHALDELPAQCDKTAPPGAEDRAWRDARPAGNEPL